MIGHICGESNLGARDDRVVRPIPMIFAFDEQNVDQLGLNARLFVGFPERCLDRRLVGVSSTAWQTPSVSIVTPRRPVLKQNGTLLNEQEPSGAIQPPVTSAAGAPNPAIAIATHAIKYPPQARATPPHDKWQLRDARRADNFERVPLKIMSIVLLIPILTSCTGSTNAGAAAPLALSSTVPTISRAESPLLIPENVPTAVATAIFEYFRLFNLALETGRTGDLVQLVAKDCPCLNPVGAIHAIYHDGVLLGARYRITRLTLISQERSWATIQVESKRGIATQVTASTGARHQFPEHQNITNFILKNIDESWLIISSEDPR